MKLKEYLDKNMIVYKRFSDALGIPYSTLHHILRTNSEPSLRNAIAIHKFTKGEVSFEDLLSTRVKKYRP